jgi:hypothetical protein
MHVSGEIKIRHLNAAIAQLVTGNDKASTMMTGVT